MSTLSYGFILLNVVVIFISCVIFTLSPGLYLLHLIGHALAVYSLVLGGITSIFVIHYMITE